MERDVDIVKDTCMEEGDSPIRDDWYCSMFGHKEREIEIKTERLL